MTRHDEPLRNAPRASVLLRRLLLGALVGAVLASIWWLLLAPKPPLPLRLLGPDSGTCHGDVGECLGPFARTILLFGLIVVLSVLMHVLAGWGLLALARVRPAWLVALIGAVAAAVIGAVLVGTGVAGAVPFAAALLIPAVAGYGATAIATTGLSRRRSTIARGKASGASVPNPRV